MLRRAAFTLVHPLTRFLSGRAAIGPPAWWGATPTTHPPHWGAAGLAATTALLAALSQVAFTEQEEITAADVTGLVEDLAHGSPAQRQQAAALLSDLSVWLEHHDTMLQAGVLDVVLAALTDASEGNLQLQLAALPAAANLMKAAPARKQAAASPAVLSVAAASLLGEGAWAAAGAGERAAARAQAARFLSELCGDCSLHPSLIQQGTAQAVLQAAGAAGEAGAAAAGHGEEQWQAALEAERSLAGGVFGITGGCVLGNHGGWTMVGP